MFAAADLFEHVARGARGDGLEKQLVFGIGGEHDHACVFKRCDDLARCLDAASSGQADIHHHNIGFVPFGLPDGFIGCAGFSDDLKLRIPGEEGFQSKANDFMVIYEHDSQHDLDLLW